MNLRCTGTAILIVLLTILLVLFIAINYRRLLTLYKKIKFKKQPNNLMHIDKIIRPVTVVKDANSAKNRSLTHISTKQHSNFLSSPILTDDLAHYTSLQSQQIGTYLLDNTGSDRSTPDITTSDEITDVPHRKEY